MDQKNEDAALKLLKDAVEDKAFSAFEQGLEAEREEVCHFHQQVGQLADDLLLIFDALEKDEHLQDVLLMLVNRAGETSRLVFEADAWIREGDEVES